MVKYDKSVSTETAMNFIREHGFDPEVIGTYAEGRISFDVMPVDSPETSFEDVDIENGRVNFQELKWALGY